MDLVSLCLLGCPCRYDGGSRPDAAVLARLRDEVVIPVCPENLAGLPTPRPRIHISAGTGEDVLDGHARVVSEDGRDVTDGLLRAAEVLAALAEALPIKTAYLKERSPSCGVTQTAGPEGVRDGVGVAAAALRRAGVRIVGVA